MLGGFCRKGAGGGGRQGGRGRGAGRGRGQGRREQVRCNAQANDVRVESKAVEVSDSNQAVRRETVAKVNGRQCMLCGACVPVCPTGAITLDDAGISIDADACRSCGLCVRACPRDAIELS